MTCTEIRPLLHAFLDDELDPDRAAAVQTHLDTCPACAREHAAHRALRAGLRDEALRFDPPRNFDRRIRAALKEAAPRPGPRRFWTWLPAGAAAALLAAILLTLRLAPWAPSADDLTLREVVGIHVRSLMADHLTDVASTDQHTVKPWFNGRLDFSPPVQDLADKDFPLVGGRLEYLDGKAVAALVYRHRLHVINLLVSPAAGEPERKVVATTRQGYHLLRWTRNGTSYWAVSDLNEAELIGFAHLIP
jgi:anti-sigma factor RsiW